MLSANLEEGVTANLKSNTLLQSFSSQGQGVKFFNQLRQGDCVNNKQYVDVTEERAVDMASLVVLLVLKQCGSLHWIEAILSM